MPAVLPFGIWAILILIALGGAAVFYSQGLAQRLGLAATGGLALVLGGLLGALMGGFWLLWRLFLVHRV